MSATFESINNLLEDIITKVSLHIEEEKKIMDRIQEIKHINYEYRTLIAQEQQLPDPKMPILPPYQPQQQPLQAIQSICSNVISRINTLREYKTKITHISESLYRITPKVSVKDYISRCSNEDMKKCYDEVDKKIKDIIKFDFGLEHQIGLEQLFRYKLYDLIYDNDKDTFRTLLVSDKKYTYSETKELVQRGGKDVRLLQIIKMSTINNILSFLNRVNSVKDTAQLLEKKENNIELKNTGELTADECLQIYKNGEIINAIVSFFYTVPIIPPHPSPRPQPQP